MNASSPLHAPGTVVHAWLIPFSTTPVTHLVKLSPRSARLWIGLAKARPTAASEQRAWIFIFKIILDDSDDEVKVISKRQRFECDIRSVAKRSVRENRMMLKNSRFRNCPDLYRFTHRGYDASGQRVECSMRNPNR